ncbi:MAG: hypothetical protein JWQ87_2653 [Candidatus Sulfotelmatobacter sp.]|nr:hypothetical protein [Candidatus Sulfotelmatobacter sp.]
MTLGSVSRRNLLSLSPSFHTSSRLAVRRAVFFAQAPEEELAASFACLARSFFAGTCESEHIQGSGHVLTEHSNREALMKSGLPYDDPCLLKLPSEFCCEAHQRHRLKLSKPLLIAKRVTNTPSEFLYALTVDRISQFHREPQLLCMVLLDRAKFLLEASW